MICHAPNGKKFRSLSYKQNEVLKGKFGKINSSQKYSYPFEKFSVNQLQQELQSRNVDISHLKKTKKDLLPTLEKTRPYHYDAKPFKTSRRTRFG